MELKLVFFTFRNNKISIFKFYLKHLQILLNVQNIQNTNNFNDRQMY